MRVLLAILAVSATVAACARPEPDTLMPQRQEVLDRYEQCHEDSIGNAEHARDCRDAVSL